MVHSLFLNTKKSDTPEMTKREIINDRLSLRVIPQGTVDNNLGPEPFSKPYGSRSQLLQTTNPLIALPLSGSPNCAW